MSDIEKKLKFLSSQVNFAINTLTQAKKEIENLQEIVKSSPQDDHDFATKPVDENVPKGRRKINRVSSNSTASQAINKEEDADKKTSNKRKRQQPTSTTATDVGNNARRRSVRQPVAAKKNDEGSSSTATNDGNKNAKRRKVTRPMTTEEGEFITDTCANFLKKHVHITPQNPKLADDHEFKVNLAGWKFGQKVRDDYSDDAAPDDRMMGKVNQIFVRNGCNEPHQIVYKTSSGGLISRDPRKLIKLIRGIEIRHTDSISPEETESMEI
mmetsp:Transcript_16299/g.18803  ORF Transcript_16299/g.18803 Transcript_16299/m.18803 type:complete len:269 (-) Transcript_16299:123-929(-)